MAEEQSSIKKNGIKELMEFFSTPERPVTTQEFTNFWKSLSLEEKEYYKNAAI